MNKVTIPCDSLHSGNLLRSDFFINIRDTIPLALRQLWQAAVQVLIQYHVMTSGDDALCSTNTEMWKKTHLLKSLCAVWSSSELSTQQHHPAN